MHSVEIILGLILLATVVAALAGRLSAPAPSLLVLAGLVVGLAPGVAPVQLSPDLVGLVVLPPLLYAAGQDLSLTELRRVWRAVSVLAVGLVLATAAAVALVAVLLVGVSLPVGFVLGAIVASTDPVAVTALARTLRLPPRLQTLVAAESLFNDATSLVMFRVAAATVVAGGSVPWHRALAQLLLLAVGGVVTGLVVAVGVAAVRRRTEDPVLETVITLVAPYTAYVVAETLGASGVTAVVVTGVAVGALGTSVSSARTRLQLTAVTGTVVFLLESVVFSLIGLQLPSLVRHLQVATLDWVLPALAVTATVVVMRALWVYPLALLTVRPTSWRAPAVVTWAGTRGVVPLAAALSVPLMVDSGRPFPQRDLLLVLAISVSVVTLVVQGLTLQPLTLRAGVAEGPEREDLEEAHADHALAQAGLDRAHELLAAELAAPFLVARCIADLTVRRDRAGQRLADQDSRDQARHHDGVGEADAAYRSLQRDLLRTETHRLSQLLVSGAVSEAVGRRVQHRLDLQDAALLAKGP